MNNQPGTIPLLVGFALGLALGRTFTTPRARSATLAGGMSIARAEKVYPFPAHKKQKTAHKTFRIRAKLAECGAAEKFYCK